MKQYIDLITTILEQGEYRKDRTGVGTKSIFGYQTKFDLREGFPLVTTKFTPFRLIVLELLWIMKGQTNIKHLNENNCHIWDEWADENGDLGPIYGHQWRALPGNDQVAKLVEGLITNPTSRRHIINSWNVEQIDDMALPPCHVLAQFYVSNSNELSCQLYQRSCDVFLGGPFNIAFYSLLTEILAEFLGYKAKEFIWTIGDAHLYSNHMTQVETLLHRTPKRLPSLKFESDFYNIVNFPDDINVGMFFLKDYEYHPAIPAPVAV